MDVGLCMQIRFKYERHGQARGRCGCPGLVPRAVSKRGRSSPGPRAAARHRRARRPRQPQLPARAQPAARQQQARSPRRALLPAPPLVLAHHPALRQQHSRPPRGPRCRQAGRRAGQPPEGPAAHRRRRPPCTRSRTALSKQLYRAVYTCEDAQRAAPRGTTASQQAELLWSKPGYTRVLGQECWKTAVHQKSNAPLDLILAAAQARPAGQGQKGHTARKISRTKGSIAFYRGQVQPLL